MVAPLTTLIGRDESIAEAAALLRRDDVRLLTITGPGGIGKTRLAQAVASVAADEFADGVVFVPLQSVRDPGHVVGTIARSLGLFDGEGDLEQRLVAHVEGRRLLLVVDNFEQVVDAASALAAIVAASPSLKVAVTSRTRLRVSGEQEFPLAPLTRDAAVSLFVERARAVRPDFQPDEADLDAIAEICGHLDDLPLAIELAATRVKLLSPTSMLARMEHRLELLTSGSRDAPSGIERCVTRSRWSVDLLGDDETALFRRLSVFVGGCTLAAVEEVCRVDLDALGSLVDMSLVRADGDRFGMLETIREYAGELLESGEGARRPEGSTPPTTYGSPRRPRRASPSDQARWRTTLEADHDNLRAALSFSLGDGRRRDRPPTLRRALALLVRAWLPERGTALARRRARLVGRAIADPCPRR